MVNRDLTPQLVREYFSYDPDTGILRWRICSGRKYKYKPGDVAGRQRTGPDGLTRIQIHIGYKTVYAYRLIWAYMTGGWPTQTIDHINGNSSDDRWCNLREATRSQNQWNQRQHCQNTSGYKGVSWNKQKRKWTAQIEASRRHYNLGAFDTKEEARDAYISASKQLHGEFSYFHQKRPSGA